MWGSQKTQAGAFQSPAFFINQTRSTESCFPLFRTSVGISAFAMETPNSYGESSNEVFFINAQ